MDPATRDEIITKRLQQESDKDVREKLRKLLIERQTPFTLPTANVERIKQLGAGSFGIVELVRYQKKLYAQKRARYNTSEQYNSILKEGLELTDIAQYHPNIQRLNFINLKNLGLLLHYCPNGSLDEVIIDENSNYTLVDVINWGYQLADALSFLHSKHIIHRDVKAQNILLKHNYQTLVLTDYGTATHFGRSLMTNEAGTPIIMAPEVIRGCVYDKQCDIYSWAIVFWQLLTKQLLPYGNQGKGFLIGVVHKKLRPSELKHAPKLFTALLYRSWHSIPDERPTLSFIRKVLRIILYSLPKRKQEYTEEMIDDLKEQWTTESSLSTRYFPREPRSNNEESMNIYHDHLKMAKHTLEVKRHLLELKQKQANHDHYEQLLNENEQLQKDIDALNVKMLSKAT